MPAASFWKDVPDYLENGEILDVDQEDKTGDVENSNSDEMEENPDSNNDVQMDEDPDSCEMEEDLDSLEMEEDLESDTSEEADDEETPFQPIIVDGNNKLFYRHQVVALSTACFNVYMNVSPGVIPHMVSRIYF